MGGASASFPSAVWLAVFSGRRASIARQRSIHEVGALGGPAAGAACGSLAQAFGPFAAAADARGEAALVKDPADGLVAIGACP